MKQKLLLALLALFTLGWTNASAQSWTASEVGAGNFHLYNVGKGQFLTSGNAWGTQASVSANSALTVIVEEYNGAYKLRTNVNGDGRGLERLSDPVIYTDQSNGKNSTWTFTKVDDASNGPVYTIVSAENHGGGSGSYMTASADNTIVGPADAVTDDYGRWQLVKSWITNSVPVIDANGWTVSETPTFDGSNVCAEFWNKSGASIKQTVNNLPAGNYELIAVALTRTGYVATLHAGSNTMNIATASTSEANNRTQANTWFNNGNGVNRLEFTHAGGSLEIGLTADNANGDHWLVWRSFVLLYKGVDLTALKESLQAQIDAVPALEGTTTTAAYNAAKNYADGIDMDALTTEEAISTASTELAALVDAAKALQPSYSRYAAIRDAALAISANVALPDVESATTTDAIDAAIPTLRANFLTELPNVTIPTDPGYIDVTAVMVDNASVRQNTDYWTIEGTPNTSYSWAKCANNECEFYQQNFKFYQTLALTPGTWEFGVTGFHRAGNHSTYFYAGEDQILIPGVESSVVNSMAAAETYFNNGNGKVALKFLIEEADNVEIGINNQDTETDKWTIFRDFTLKYYGAPDYSVYVARLAELATEAAAVEGTVPAAVYTVLNGVVTEKNTTHANKAEYLAAIAAIENAITEAKEKQGAYASYKSLNTLVQALYDVANYEELTEGAHETLGTALGNAATEVETKTTIEDINAVAETLRAAGATYAGAANPTGEAKFNLTFMLTNPDVSSFPAWTARADVPGWYTDQEDGNSQTMVNDAATSEDGTKTNFFEYWSNPAKANNEFALYQKVTLPLGTFDISCYAFAQDQYAGQNSVGVYFYANDTQGSAVTTARLTEASLSFINDAEQEVKIGLKTITGNTYNWMGIGYMELYKVPANTTEYAIITTGVQNATVVATVDGEEVTKALALKNVTLTVTANEGYLVDDVTVTYVDGEETKNVDLAKTDAGYTFQMPAFDVTVNVTTVALATAEDYEALNNLINSYVFGFDENEYSPYMNIAGIKAIAAAKAIDQTAENTKQVVEEAEQAIRSAGWIGNAVEVNAFYDGYFKAQSVPSENTRPLGWQRHSTTANSADGTDGGYETRLMTLVDGITDSNQGMMTKFHAFYGEQEGYTLPLKANTTYALNFKYAGWGNTPTMHINVYSEDGTRVSQSGNFTTKDNAGDKNADSWTEYSYIFTTAEAGNYVIGLIKNTGGTEQNQAGFTDLSLYRAQSVDITIKDGFTATTYSNENALDFSNTEGLTACIITDAEGTEVEVSSVPAETGVYVKGEPGTYKAYILGTSNTDVSENKLVGTVNTATQLTSNETTTYYVFGRQGDPKKEAFYKVKTDKATNVSANKAYLKFDVSASDAKDVITVGGGETDGINAVEAAETLNGDIYNLQGQKVNHTTRGIYIVNGKKIVIK